jgi:hypothetical protein
MVLGLRLQWQVTPYAVIARLQIITFAQIQIVTLLQTKGAKN